MDRKSELEYLKARQRDELNNIEANITQLEQYKQDYQSLRDRVEVLPNKTRHDIMLPIAGSKMALMPAYLHHTNEFMVMIGEDYFVEMSAKETMEFVDRRMSFCDEKLKELIDNKKLIEDWIRMSTETCDTTAHGLEFIHEETEEEYQEWMKKHETLQATATKPNDTTKDAKESIDIIKFLDKYKDDEEDDHIKENDEQQDSDDEPAPVAVKPAPSNPQNTEPVTKEPQLILPTIVEHKQTDDKKRAQGTVQPTQTTRPISKFRASRMK